MHQDVETIFGSHFCKDLYAPERYTLQKFYSLCKQIMAHISSCHESIERSFPHVHMEV